MKRIGFFLAAISCAPLILVAEVKTADALFKRWFLKDALNQHVYADVTLKNLSQNVNDSYLTQFKNHINKHQKLLEPTFGFLNNRTGWRLHESSELNFTFSEKLKKRVGQVCNLLDADVRGFVELVKRKGLIGKLLYNDEAQKAVENVIDKYDNMIGSFILAPSKKILDQRKFAVANRFFEFCFDEKTFPYFKGLQKIDAYNPVVNMLYSVIWKNLVGKGWISWHHETIKYLKQEAAQGKTIVYFAGGNDIYQLVKNGIYSINVIDPMLGDTQSPYYIWDWEWFNKGTDKNNGIGDQLLFNVGSKKIVMKRERYEIHGSFDAVLSNKKTEKVSQTTTVWGVFEDQGATKKRVGSISFERRFVTQQDLVPSPKKVYLASFNEGYYAFLPHTEGGWGLDLNSAGNDFKLSIKQLRKPLLPASIKNLVESVMDKNAVIKLGSCAT